MELTLVNVILNVASLLFLLACIVYLGAQNVKLSQEREQHIRNLAQALEEIKKELADEDEP